MGLFVLTVAFAYGHTAPEPLVSHPISINDETFSTEKTRIGENPITINGKIINHQNTHRIAELSAVAIRGQSPHGYQDSTSLYFKIKTNLPENKIDLQPYEEKPFQIELIPLKDGNYHIHSALIVDNKIFLAPGGSVSIEGSSITMKHYTISPLKQIKTGTQPHNVVCDSSLELAQKKGNRMSACVKLETKIELIIRGWAQDDRILLGCIGDRVSQCYPDDPKEYRNKLYDSYFGKGNLPSSSDYNFTTLHTINACTDKPWVCYGELGNGTKIRVSCDYPIHGCGVKSFDNHTGDRK